MLGAPLPDQERGDQRAARDQRAEDGGAGPAELGAADDAVDDPEQTGAREGHAWEVELPGRAVALGQAAGGERDHGEAPGAAGGAGGGAAAAGPGRRSGSGGGGRTESRRVPRGR